ncbi:hypothetical protein KI387_019930, partial [Taxus chinensis]
TVDEWWDLIHRVCTDSLMIPMDKTHAELSVYAGEPSIAGRHTDVFAPIWYVARMVSTLCTELAGYRTAERVMRIHSHGETVVAPREPEPSVYLEHRRSRSPRRGRVPSEGLRR